MFYVKILTLAIAFVSVHSQLPTTLQKNASCENSLAEYITLGEIHSYQLTLHETYDVTFQSCSSETDIVIVVNDANGIDISNSWCSGGDWCGSCPKEDKYPEHFTLPDMVPGTYFIEIHAYQFGDPGNYQLHISCIVNYNNNSITPSPTTYYTTSVTSYCADRFLCHKTGVCIDISKICDGINDCPDNEDESESCTVCFGDISGLFGGPFEFFSYNVTTKSIIYKNSVNNYYLYPSDITYTVGSDYNTFSPFYAFCLISNLTNLKLENCIGWTTDGVSFDTSIIVDIGCTGCDYSCIGSQICINNAMLCDGISDCYLNDDEEQCDVCVDSNVDNYLYFSGEYSYIDYDNIYRGNIYFDGLQWYIHPLIYSFESTYLYSYVITSNQSDVLAYCSIGVVYELLPYFVMEIEFCSFWYIYLPTGDFLDANITAEYCKTNVSDTSPSQNASHSNTSTLFVIPHWINSNNSNGNTITFYIASDGWDTDHCGLEHDPCGTLSITSQYASFVANNVEHITSIILVIRGQNREEILFSNRYFQFNPCYARFEVSIDSKNTLSFSTISYIFDPDYIKSLNDWFPIFPSSQELCQYNAINSGWSQDSFFQITQVETVDEEPINFAVVDFIITFQNLIITDWRVVNKETKPNFIAGMAAAGYLNIKYTFRNLTFVNNIIMYASTSVVHAPSIEIYQSTMSNNILNINSHSIFSTNIDKDTLPDSKQIRFIMKESLISDNKFSNSTSFVDIIQHPNSAELLVEVINNTFNNISLTEASLIINIFGIIKSNHIVINHLIVHGVDGTIINVDGVNSGICVINDINVHTSKMVQILDDEDKEYATLFLITSQNSAINISNVNITYLISDQLVNHCWADSYMNDKCWFNQGSLAHLDTTAFRNYKANAGVLYVCDVPILFMHSLSDDQKNMINISSITVCNDITQTSLQVAKNKLFEKNNWLCNITINTPATIQYSTASTPAGFITINGGYVNLHGLYIYGGANSIMIVQKGIASQDVVQITNINSYYGEYCSDMICPFDAYALHINIFVVNWGVGTMQLSDSKLYGAKMGFLRIDSGNNYVLNSSMHYGYSVIETINTVTTLQLIDCEFVNVGQHYVVSLLGFDILLTFPEDHWILHTPPLILAGSNMLIQNCYFNTDHNAGIILFSPSWPSTSKSVNVLSTVIFINNTVERNSDSIIYNISKIPYQANGIINIFGNVKLYVIGNTIIETSISKDDKALLYIDSDGSTCFSGNTFTASTIINVGSENTGPIISCFRYNIQNIFGEINQCYYGSLGKASHVLDYEVFSDSSPMDYWTAINPDTAIIQTTSTAIMLDNITFAATFDANNYIIMKIIAGEFVLLDAIVNQSFISFVHDFVSCNIICFDVLQNYYNHKEQLYISQLHVNCSTMNQNAPNNLKAISMNLSSWINHTTPYYIYFIYNEQYVVDSNLEMSFYITDQFTNIINDYSSLLSIVFYNAELQIDDLYIVKLYDSMMLKPIVTNDRAFENFTIKAVVNRHELIVPDDVKITILPRDYSKEVINQDLLWLFALLAIPACIIVVCYAWCHNQYNKAFVVNKTLVLLIGISQFDERKLFLPGVRIAIDTLSNLWEVIYNYDVFICKNDTLDATKNDIIDFIDKYKKRLDDPQYNGVIIHIISHGSETDSFLTSDGKHMKTSGFIQHEITSEIEMRDKSENSDVVKLIFHHQCRGTAIFHTGKLKHRTTDTIQSEMQPIKKSEEKFEEDTGSNNGQEEKNANSNNGDEMFSDDANWITIYGTIDGRAMSDKGNFSDCIYESFDKNIKRNWSLKKDLIQLVTEIGQNLERQTRSAEICTIKSNLRYEKIRFEPSKKQIEPINSLDDHDETMPLSDNEFSDNLYDMNSIELVQVTHHEEKDNNDVAIEEDEDDEKKVLVNKQTDRKDCTSKQILHK
eukprot:421683_1